MSATDKIFIDDSLPQCAAADLNGFKNENTNLISGSGQTPSTADNQQTHKAIAIYAAGGNFYTDSGAANAYVLSPVGSKIAPPAYFDGMSGAFEVGNTNTGPSTLNPATLGVKNIFLNGAALVGGELPAGSIAEWRYDLANDRVNLGFVIGLYMPLVGAVTKAGDLTLTDELIVSNIVPRINLKESGYTADEGWWDLFANSGVVYLTARNDDGSQGDVVFQASRVGTGSSISVVDFPNGTLKAGGNQVWDAGNLAAGTRGAVAYRSANQSIPNITNTKIAFDAEITDTDAIHASGVFTVPAGISQVVLAAAVDMIGLNDKLLFVYKNGVRLTAPNVTCRVFTVTTSAQITVELRSPVLTVTPGDYFEFFVYQSSGGAQNVVDSTVQTCWGEMKLIR